MTTPHEAVVKALAYKAGHYDTDAEHVSQIPNEDWLIEPSDVHNATAAIEALRSGAYDRIIAEFGCAHLHDERAINAILGPPNEVPE